MLSISFLLFFLQLRLHLMGVLPLLPLVVLAFRCVWISICRAQNSAKFGPKKNDRSPEYCVRILNPLLRSPAPCARFLSGRHRRIEWRVLLSPARQSHARGDPIGGAEACLAGHVAACKIQDGRMHFNRLNGIHIQCAGNDLNVLRVPPTRPGFVYQKRGIVCQCCRDKWSG